MSKSKMNLSSGDMVKVYYGQSRTLKRGIVASDSPPFPFVNIWIHNHLWKCVRHTDGNLYVCGCEPGSGEIIDL